MDAAEDDRLRVGGGSLVREPERVAHEVGDILHLGHLVVVGEDHRPAFSRERAHFLLERRDLGRRAHSISNETSRERAE